MNTDQLRGREGWRTCARTAVPNGGREHTGHTSSPGHVWIQEYGAVRLHRILDLLFGVQGLDDVIGGRVVRGLHAPIGVRGVKPVTHQWSTHQEHMHKSGVDVGVWGDWGD